MKSVEATPLFHVQNTLGEGPLWHPTENHLYWVDIESGDLYKAADDFSSYQKFHFETMIGAFAFSASGGFVLATAEGFAVWTEGLPGIDVLWNPLPERPGVRLNDGKVDPGGRFFAGSMDIETREGKLYRLDPDRSKHTILHHIGISNGLDWSPDRKTMVYTDTLQHTIFAFDYDVDTGEIENQRPLVQLPVESSDVVPDGLCVDAEGYIWGAQWNGWKVVRYSPQGKPILQVKVPAQRVTSCCFGGEKLNQLIITSARSGLSEKELQSQPYAGDVFIYETDTQGQPANLFGA